MQEHVIGGRETDVPTPDGHHLQGRAGRQVEHQVWDGLQERVEHLRQRADRLAGQVQVTERMPAPGIGRIRGGGGCGGGPVGRAHLGRQRDHEPPQQVVQARRPGHLVK